MDNILSILKTDNFLIALSAIVVIMLIGFLVILIKLSRLSKRYKQFIKKLGNGENIQEDLENYMYRVERTEKQNAEILFDIDNLKNDLKKCVQKVGIIRYNAYKDAGSNLSFTLALLNEKNDGVVLNGIYSREMSNIYAKPVSSGKSSFTLSDEEQQAVNQAIKEKN